MALETVGDIALGVHQEIAWQTNNALIRATTGRRWQFGNGSIRDVDTNHSKVTIVKLPDVRTSLTGCGLRAVLVRVRADALGKSHEEYVTVVSYLVNLIHAYFLGVKTHKSYAELSERIVRLLRDERIRQGLSKYAVEQRSGISQQMVGYVERGLRRPSLETALRMADGLGVDLARIITKARKLTPKRRS